MTVVARIMWTIVVATLVAGGIVITSVNGRRAAARDILAELRGREARLEREADRVERALHHLRNERTRAESIKVRCFEALRVQTSEWNRLVEDTPSRVFSPSEFAPYIERARGLVSEARDIAAVCSAAI